MADSDRGPRAQAQKEMLGFVHQCICCEAKFKSKRGLKLHLGRHPECRRAAKMAELKEKKEEKSGLVEKDPLDLNESTVGNPGQRRRSYSKEEKEAAVKAVRQVEAEAGVHHVKAVQHVSKMLGIPVKRIRLFFIELEKKGNQNPDYAIVAFQHSFSGALKSSPRQCRMKLNMYDKLGEFKRKAIRNSVCDYINL